MIYALLLSIAFAGWRSRHVSGLFLYFCTQALYTVAGLLAYRWYGDRSDAYAIVYAAGTGLILVVVVGVVREVVLTKQHSSRGMVLAAVIAVCTSHWLYSYLGHEANYKEMIQIIEATMLIWAGLILGGTALYVERRAISVVLSLLWLSLAWFRWAFVLNFPDPQWVRLNWQVPGWSCVAAFVVIGLLLRPLPLHAKR